MRVPFVTAKLPRLEGAAYDNSHISIKMTDTHPAFLYEGCNKKRSWEAPFFNQIQVVLVLGWQLEL